MQKKKNLMSRVNKIFVLHSAFLSSYKSWFQHSFSSKKFFFLPGWIYESVKEFCCPINPEVKSFELICWPGMWWPPPTTWSIISFLVVTCPRECPSPPADSGPESEWLLLLLFRFLEERDFRRSSLEGHLGVVLKGEIICIQVLKAGKVP